MESLKLEKNIDSADNGKRLPKDAKNDYTLEIIGQRIKWLEKKLGIKLNSIPHFIGDPLDTKGHIENLIGTVSVPVGIAGPLLMKGEKAQGEFYVPFATTEGAIVTTYNAGMRVLTKAGGVAARVLNDDTHISPVFRVRNMVEGKELIDWIEKNFDVIKKEAESTTAHGKLRKIETFLMGRRVISKFSFFTADANGMNMINVATEKACQFISAKTGKKFFVRSNFSSVKKFSTRNMHCGFGKSVFAECVIPRKTLEILRTTPEAMCEQFTSCYLVSSQAGMMGINAQTANCIAAIFLACGQDLADVSVSHVAFSMCETTEENDLYASMYIPNLLIGTVGGGTCLPTQSECLRIMDCYGAGNVGKFAEIIAATALAGEVATTAAIANNTFVQIHASIGRSKDKKS